MKTVLIFIMAFVNSAFAGGGVIGTPAGGVIGTPAGGIIGSPAGKSSPAISQGYVTIVDSATGKLVDLATARFAQTTMLNIFRLCEDSAECESEMSAHELDGRPLVVSEGRYVFELSSSHSSVIEVKAGQITTVNIHKVSRPAGLNTAQALYVLPRYTQITAEERAEVLKKTGRLSVMPKNLHAETLIDAQHFFHANMESDQDSIYLFSGVYSIGRNNSILKLYNSMEWIGEVAVP